jgi:ribosomal protein L37E
MPQPKDIREGRGFGYRDDSGRVWMIRCFSCGRENWAPAVASCQCAWCGYKYDQKVQPLLGPEDPEAA